MEAPIAFIVYAMYTLFLYCSIVETYIDKDLQRFPWQSSESLNTVEIFA